MRRLEARDDDLDQFIFMLDNTKTYPAEVTLSSDGLLEFTPVPNYASTVDVYFKVIVINIQSLRD